MTRKTPPILLGLALLQCPSMGQSAVQVAGAPTYTAVRDGPWTSAATWGGSLPGDSARVLIPADITVTVNAVVLTEFKSVRIAKRGKLRFATGVKTELRTEYLVSEGPTKSNGVVTVAGGTLEMGTATGRVASTVTARLVFAEKGGTTLAEDPQRFAPGAILMGPVRMHGTEKTSWLAFATPPAAGATQLVLKSAPAGWRVGDKLAVAGTDPTDYRSDEVVTISSISGNIVTIDAPLARNHKPPAQVPGLEVHVANLTRNVVIASANSSVSAIGGNPYRKPRGHVMFMHNLDVQLKYVGTENIGRTDKQIELDDWSAEGLPKAPQTLPRIPGGYKNPRGRYSLHFHRGGKSPQLTPALVEGCVVNGDPGWGFVNHSSRVDFVKNVSYGVVGSAFCTESGDETGSFKENIAIRTYHPDEPMSPGRPSVAGPGAERTEALADARENLSDFAWQGDGFWFHSTGVTVEGNVVSGCTGHAFVYWSEGLIEDTLGIARASIDIHVPEAEFRDLNEALKAVRAQYPFWKFDIWYILPRPFKNNTAYNMARGVHGYYVMTEFHEEGDTENRAEFNLTPPLYRNRMELVIENTTLWGMRRVGMGFTHCAQITLKNNKVYGYGTSTGKAPWNPNPNPHPGLVEEEPAVIGMDLDHYHNTRNWKLENNTVEGFDGDAVAIVLPANAETVVDGGRFNNGGIDIKIREVNWRKDWPDRVVSFEDDNIDPLPTDKTTPWRNVIIGGDIRFGNPNKNIVLAPQLHMTNPAQDAFAILDGDLKMSGYHMLPDNIRLNFGPFVNAKVYFDQQRAGFTPVTAATRLPLGRAEDDLFSEYVMPPRYAGKTNQQLRTQYGVSFGGEITPSTAVTHPILVGGKVSAISTPPATAGKLVLSEIMHHPPGNPAAEFVELQNISAATISLAGVTFTHGIAFTFAGGTTLAAGARVLVVRDQAAFAAVHGSGLPVAGTYSGDLADSGERLRLQGASGATIFDFSYGITGSWPTGAGGGSLVVLRTQTNPDLADPASWRSSTLPAGNPGTSDTLSYATWAQANGVGSPTEDRDGDGVAALIEYVLGTNPNVADASRPVAAAVIGSGGTSHFALTFTRRPGRDDAVLSVEGSTNLVNWSQAAAVMSSTVRNPDRTETLTYRSTATYGSRAAEYLRLKATLPSTLP